MKLKELRLLLHEYVNTVSEMMQLRDACGPGTGEWTATPTPSMGRRQDIELPIPREVVASLMASRIAELEAAGRRLADRLGIEFDAETETEGHAS